MKFSLVNQSMRRKRKRKRKKKEKLRRRRRRERLKDFKQIYSEFKEFQGSLLELKLWDSKRNKYLIKLKLKQLWLKIISYN